MSTARFPILIVDDNPVNQEIVSEILSSSGYLVDKASNGREAVLKAGNVSYQLILMDLIMPVMNGFEAIERIRDMGVKTPIIAQTSLDSKEDINRCREAGCDEYLVKPLDMKKLLDVVAHHTSSPSISPKRSSSDVEITGQPAPAAVRSVLLVEENAQKREGFRKVLESHGFAVEVDVSGTEAWNRVADGGKHFDVVISAMFTSGIDGFGLLSRMKSRDMEVPFIIYTDEFNVQSYQLAIQLGADSIIPSDKFSRSIADTIESSVFHSQSVRREITERRRAENALRESEELYRTVIERMNDTLWITDGNGGFLFANDQAARYLCGGETGDVIGKNIVDFIPSGQAEELKALFRNTIETGTPFAGEMNVLIRGKEYRFLNRLTPFRYGPRDTPAVLSISHDITERLQLEAEREKAAKLESIGTLAGGIAHDFNNILTSILGYLTLGKVEIPPSSPARKSIEEAECEIFRAKNITRRFLTFSRGGAPVKKTVSPAEVIRNAARFSTSGSRVQCVFTLPDSLWTAEADEGQITQALNNIFLNAIEAMPAGGKIDVSAENTMVRAAAESRFEPGAYVNITIKDHGAGIPRENMARIFDPYFSTKEAGRGLGLTVAYSIVRNHLGFIDVESEPGKGTAVHVYLPASVKAAEAAPPSKTVSRGTGRILLMDDEAGVLTTTGNLLTRFGFEVDLSREGSEAVKLYQRAMAENRPYRAVILDLTVPGGMGGVETAGNLKKIDPGARLIVSSGYSDDPAMSGFKDYGFLGVARKPYMIGELIETIRGVMGEGKS